MYDIPVNPPETPGNGHTVLIQANPDNPARIVRIRGEQAQIIHHRTNRAEWVETDNLDYIGTHPDTHAQTWAYHPDLV